MVETKPKWYVLYRDVGIKNGWDISDVMDREYTIVFTINPQRTHESWKLLSGTPHDSCDDARKEIE